MLYVLIPAYNNKREVLDVLQCLSKQTYKEFKVILIDDGSTDSTEYEVRKEFPHVVILKGNGNLWWTGANFLGVNHILKEAKDEDFILFLNNDLFIDEDYLEHIVKAHLETKSIVGSVLYDYRNKNKIVNAGILTDNFINLNLNINKKTMDKTGLEYYESDFLPGRGTLYPIPVFKKIGNLNKVKLPHYAADYEFSCRARNAGYKLIVAHDAKVYAKLDITGFKLDPNKKIISFRECYLKLFSKKSPSHIYYYSNYVWMCSKKEFRLRNTFISIINLLTSSIFRTIPGYPVYFLATFLVRCLKKIKNKI